MKQLFGLIITILIGTLVFFNLEDISNFLSKFLNNEKKVTILNSNEYKKDYNFKFIKMSESYIPYSYQDLLDIFFSTLNNGWDTFTFYCPDEYTNCLKDVNSISQNKTLLSDINNFVHPFNSFSKISVATSSTGEVTINITKLYSKEDINKINNGIDNILREKITNDMSNEDKIKVIHDYIINNTKYDANKVNESSYTAMGPLFDGTAVCSGYSDLMEIFLTRLGLKNFKVASETHVWNVVYLNDEWLNLDLTWDDPITKDSDVDTLLHQFFLIKVEKLLEFDTTDHTFDPTIYQELA